LSPTGNALREIDVMQPSLARTALAGLQPGGRINVERAPTAGVAACSLRSMR
jgi:riboflavin synthase alpha subunit